MDQPLKVLCELEGWKDAETVLNRYQWPGQDHLREALSWRKAIQDGHHSPPRKGRESLANIAQNGFQSTQ